MLRLLLAGLIALAHADKPTIQPKYFTRAG